jgi:hypothetical protein
MRKIIALSVLCLPFAFGATQQAHAQGVPDNACVSASYENGNASFTNTCGHNVTIIVTNQHNTWTPGLLSPGGAQTYDQSLAPFRYYACDGNYHAKDQVTQGWPSYKTVNYVCVFP